MPSYSYDLDRAVADRFLVPYASVEVPLKFLRGGIKYDDLSEEEKEEWDAIEWDEEQSEGTRCRRPCCIEQVAVQRRHR